MKTLAELPLSEFLPAAYRLRGLFHDYYKLIGTDDLMKHYADIAKNAEPDERKKVSGELISRIFERVMCLHPKETVELIAALCLMTPEEAEKLPPNEAIAAVMSCIRSEKVMDFFISLEASAQNDSGGILLLLISLKLSASENPTSGTASGTSTETTSENATSTGTSESALDA